MKVHHSAKWMVSYTYKDGILSPECLAYWSRWLEVDSGPRYLICVFFFARPYENFTRFSHGRVFYDSRNVQKRATKSDTSDHCLDQSPAIDPGSIPGSLHFRLSNWSDTLHVMEYIQLWTYLYALNIYVMLPYLMAILPQWLAVSPSPALVRVDCLLQRLGC